MPLGAARLTLLAKSQVTAVAEVIRKKVAISALGNAQIDTADYKFGGASALLDGTGDALTTGTSADTGSPFYLMEGPWTLELWFNPVTDTGSSSAYLITDRSGGYSTYNLQLLYRNLDNKIQLGWNANNGSDPTQSIGGGSPLSAAVTNNTWNHLAMVYDGTYTSVWLNGTRFANFTMTYSNLLVNATGQWGFGGDIDNATLPFNQGGNGYIDEVRISSTARYDPTSASITVPTEPFVNDDDTMLLLHMNGTDGSTLFEDDNGTGRAAVGVSAVGNAQVDTAQSKFGGASAVFDGTGDALLFDDPINVGDFSSKRFTLECWIYPTADNASYRQIINNSWPAAVADRGWALTINPSDKIAFLYGYGTTQYYNFFGTTTITTGTWYHIAIVGDGTDLTMYIDGVEEATHTPSSINVGGENCAIGANYTGSGGEFTGNIDELRISDTARYTTGFTAPTEPFQNDANTLMLLHMDGTDGSTDFLDDNGKGRSAIGVSAQGTGQVDTAQYKFGGSSFVADGSGDDNLAIDQNAYDWTVFNDHTQSSNYTIECWIRSTNVGTTNAIFGTRTSNAADNWDLEIRTNNGNGTLRWFNGNSQLYYSAGGVVSANTWHHVAAVIEGADLTVYVDGTAVITQTRTDSNTTGGSDFFIGKGGYPTLNKFYGNIDEFRISSTARYTSGFTPATEPFQNDADTILLLHMDGTNGSTTFVDDNGTYTG